MSLRLNRNLIPANYKRKKLSEQYSVIVIKVIYENGMQNKTLNEIIEFLDSEGIPPPRHKEKINLEYKDFHEWAHSPKGKKWSRASLSRLLIKYRQ